MTKSPAERTWYCSICDQPFTNDEWLDRHTSADGGDCHERCCDVCAMEDATDLEEQLDALLYRGAVLTVERLPSHLASTSALIRK